MKFFGRQNEIKELQEIRNPQIRNRPHKMTQRSKR